MYNILTLNFESTYFQLPCACGQRSGLESGFARVKILYRFSTLQIPHVHVKLQMPVRKVSSCVLY